MANEAFTIYYDNEDDRAYGLAGMALTIASLDAIGEVAEVSLDTDGPMVTFSNEYYFPASASLSPKAHWDRLLRNFHLTASMVLGNVMARSLVRLGRDVPVEVLGRIHDTIIDEGRETCSLEDDETEALFSRTLSRANRIFHNPRLHPAVKELVAILSRRRRLSGRELEEQLSHLPL